MENKDLERIEKRKDILSQDSKDTFNMKDMSRSMLYSMIPLVIQSMSDLTDGAKILYGQLAGMACVFGSDPEVSLERLAVNQDSSTRQITRYIQELKGKKLIKVIRRMDKTSIYQFLKHEAFLGSDQPEKSKREVKQSTKNVHIPVEVKVNTVVVDNPKVEKVIEIRSAPVQPIIKVKKIEHEDRTNSIEAIPDFCVEADENYRLKKIKLAEEAAKQVEIDKINAEKAAQKLIDDKELEDLF